MGPLWSFPAAGTKPKSSSHRSFCAPVCPYASPPPPGHAFIAAFTSPSFNASFTASFQALYSSHSMPALRTFSPISVSAFSSCVSETASRNASTQVKSSLSTSGSVNGKSASVILPRTRLNTFVVRAFVLAARTLGDRRRLSSALATLFPSTPYFSRRSARSPSIPSGRLASSSSTSQSSSSASPFSGSSLAWPSTVSKDWYRGSIVYVGPMTTAPLF